MTGDTTTTTRSSSDPGRGDVEPERLGVVLCGCAAEPSRLGELLFVDGGAVVGRKGDPFLRQRPGSAVRTGPIDDPQLSRTHLRFAGGAVLNEGRLPLYLDGRPILEAPIRPGDVLRVGDRLVLLVVRRPETMPGETPPGAPTWGGADADGWVGESPLSWHVRSQVAFVAERGVHVLVLGESGTGKELVARALHRRSTRSRGPFVARSAATIPASLADAELFGNLKGYPNPGMPARPGLVGESDQGTLFLDEFGELPLDLQARLLRVLDAGEYSPLGEARAHRADLRLIAATNADPATLKHDVLARFPIRLRLPGLGERIEDLPLLVRFILRRIASSDAGIAARVLSDGGDPQIRMRLIERLMCHRYTTHLRELEARLWERILASDGGWLDDGGEVVAPVPPPSIDPASLDPDVIQAFLDRNGGRQEPTWRELGLASRYVLKRLVKKHGLRVRGQSS